MRLYYSYDEIKNLKIQLSSIVNRINNNPFISTELKKVANEMDNQLIHYNEVLNKLEPGEKVTDFEMVQGFNKTEMYIKEINKVL
ncbi:hypothetical protein [Clostridium sp.]|uniref:hypothetical protein n=1 Tax=Clostridium sp. TaxID=1506 RepID=UPI003D6CDC06